MPAYNHEAFVLQALDSTLDSGLDDIEFLICDDASTDATPVLIRDWVDQNRGAFRRLEFIARTRNAGLCASLNELTALAQGEVIHLLASDDFLLPGGLRAATLAMLERPEVDYLFCDGQAVGLDGEIFAPSLLAAGGINPARLTPALAPEELLFHWVPPANMHCWRARAFSAHGGTYAYDSTVFCEDLDSAWWAMSRQTLGFAPVVSQAYRYRSWPQQSSSINPVRMGRDVSYIYAKYARHFEPRIRDAMRTLSGALLATTIGDAEEAQRLWLLHQQNAADYASRCE